jgi:cell division protein FtsI/penicillin-binding protein 2
MTVSVSARIRTLSIFAFLGAMLLVVRLFYLQIVRGEYYVQEGEKQYNQTIGPSFSRGSIFFQKKDDTTVAAASTKSGYILAIKPVEITDPEGLYQSLVSVLPNLDHDDFIARASKKGDPYEQVAKHISSEAHEAILVKKLTGLVFSNERWRIYPGGTLASQVLGFVGYKGDEFAGRYGLERLYEGVLSRDGSGLYQNFFAHIFSNWRELSKEAGEGDVVLTIEPSVQSYLEGQLVAIHKKWEGKEVGGIILDPKTGKILAMGALPNYNPEEYNKVDDLAVFQNPAVESVFEMGSIMKAVTMSIGLDTKKVTPETTYVDEGSVKIKDRTISNSDGKGHGRVDMQTVLSKSLNTGSVFVEQQIGNKAYWEYLQKFGFGGKTGVDLPDEVNNLLGNLERGGPVEYANASFGQGLAVTPLAMARALSVLANNGKLVTPYVVDYIDRRGLPREVPTRKEPVEVIAPETAKTITGMLTTVVDEALLNGTVKNERYSIAAKTGTAQLTGPGGVYYKDRYFHSFFGYLPASNPSFLVFLYLKDPNVPRYASETLTLPFMSIAKFLLNYYEIPPDR